MFYFFFFQAEDGIRDIGVTGVQTCALPIFHERAEMDERATQLEAAEAGAAAALAEVEQRTLALDEAERSLETEIGRASCRGRGEISVVAGSFKKKICTYIKNIVEEYQ